MNKKIDALLKNAATFTDKGNQVSPNSFTAFGISLSSRYGKADEIIQMLGFAQVATAESVAHYVKEIYFDSKACICSFVLDDTVVQGSEIEIALLCIAKKCFHHFFWFDDEILSGEDA